MLASILISFAIGVASLLLLAVVAVILAPRAERVPGTGRHVRSVEEEARS